MTPYPSHRHPAPDQKQGSTSEFRISLTHLEHDAAYADAHQAEDIIDVVLFTPSHQLLAAEAGVGSEHDLPRRPALPQLLDDAADFFDSACGRILVGRPEPRAQCPKSILGTEKVPPRKPCSASRSTPCRKTTHLAPSANPLPAKIDPCEKWRLNHPRPVKNDSISRGFTSNACRGCQSCYCTMTVMPGEVLVLWARSAMTSLFAEIT